MRPLVFEVLGQGMVRGTPLEHSWSLLTQFTVPTRSVVPTWIPASVRHPQHLNLAHPSLQVLRFAVLDDWTSQAPIDASISVAPLYIPVVPPPVHLSPSLEPTQSNLIVVPAPLLDGSVLVGPATGFTPAAIHLPPTFAASKLLTQLRPLPLETFGFGGLYYEWWIPIHVVCNPFHSRYLYRRTLASIHARNIHTR